MRALISKQVWGPRESIPCSPLPPFGGPDLITNWVALAVVIHVKKMQGGGFVYSLLHHTYLVCIVFWCAVPKSSYISM